MHFMLKIAGLRSALLSTVPAGENIGRAIQLNAQRLRSQKPSQWGPNTQLSHPAATEPTARPAVAPYNAGRQSTAPVMGAKT